MFLSLRLQNENHLWLFGTTKIQNVSFQFSNVFNQTIVTVCMFIDKKRKSKLTAKRGFVRPVGAVWGVVTHPAEVNTNAVPGALPLPAGTAERGRGTVPLIAAVATVVISVTYPTAEHTVAVIAAEL